MENVHTNLRSQLVDFISNFADGQSDLCVVLPCLCHQEGRHISRSFVKANDIDTQRLG